MMPLVSGIVMLLINRLSIQSKLVVILLAVSVGSILVISTIGYTSGKGALTRSVYNQLTGTRTAKANLLRSQFASLRKDVLTLAETAHVQNAMKAFRRGFADLQATTNSTAVDEKLTAFYRDEFLPKLTASMGSEPMLESYLPRSAATRYLQYHYIAQNSQPYLKNQDAVAAPDGSAYSDAHKRFHPFFAKIATRFAFEDILLVDAHTLDILYSYQKTVAFGTNLESGPYAQSNLGDLVRSLRKSVDPGRYELVDFDRYKPNIGQPCAFVGSTVFDGADGLGFLVVKFPVDEINRVMSDDFHWERDGLGDSGEVMLVGGDYLLRSQSRFLSHDLEGLVGSLAKCGVPTQRLERIKRERLLILNLEYRAPAIADAIRGKEAIGIHQDYRCRTVLSSCAPVDLEGLRWVVVAKMDVEEAFAPAAQYGREVLASSVAIILVVTLLASALAYLFVRPINKLMKGAKQVSSGRTDVFVRIRTNDEFRDLADSFNEMTRSLKIQSELIAEKVRENEELLLNILPGPVAARMRGGEPQVAQSFADVTVLFADITGFTELSEALSAERAVGLFHDLVIAFDDVAEREGVEKFKTIGSSYMAVCGLSVQRPDHTHRMVEFALELARIVHRFNQERGVSLGCEVAINAGPVVGGIVGRSKFIYDLWGDTVNVAKGIRPKAGPLTIIVTKSVHERLRNVFDFEDAGTATLRGKGEVPIWQVKAATAAPGTSES